MTDRLPRILVVVLVAAGLTIMLAGVRQAAASIVGPTLLALVLTITVHPLRAKAGSASGFRSGRSR